MEENKPEQPLPSMHRDQSSISFQNLQHAANLSVLSINFGVDVPTGKVGGSLLFECRRREFPRGVWGHAPPENFEI